MDHRIHSHAERDLVTKLEDSNVECPLYYSFYFRVPWSKYFIVRPSPPYSQNKEIDSDTTSVESQNERSAGTYLEAEEGKFL